MADDLAAAMLAYRCELVDCALEAVEHVGHAGGHDLERKVVVVTANLALCHRSLLPA
jgi:hypothetical protein